MERKATIMNPNLYQAPELLESREVFRGRNRVLINRYVNRHGQEYEREVITHPGAVAVVVYDEEHVLLVRQPREVVGEAALLELPAGTRDHPGEPAVECAKRELAEEIGKQADSWEYLTSVYTSPGVTQERIELFLATGLSECSLPGDEDEDIEIVAWPLESLDDLIAQIQDAKTLAGLLMLKARLG